MAKLYTNKNNELVNAVENFKELPMGARFIIKQAAYFHTVANELYTFNALGRQTSVMEIEYANDLQTFRAVGTKELYKTK